MNPYIKLFTDRLIACSYFLAGGCLATSHGNEGQLPPRFINTKNSKTLTFLQDIGKESILKNITKKYILFDVEYQKNVDEGIVGILFNFYFKSSQRIYLSVYFFLYIQNFELLRILFLRSIAVKVFLKKNHLGNC